MKIHILPILKDNYAYVLEAAHGQAAVIDPGAAAPVVDFLERHNLKLTHILNTHHHGDHTAGNAELKNRYGAALVAPAAEAAQIGGVDIPLQGGQDWTWQGHTARILATPGHTLGGLCFYWPEEKAVFTGDTLFSLGCGRLFEGTAAQMWQSLQALIALPDDTMIYFGHEYTLSNGRFCLHIAPDNAALKDRLALAQSLRDQNLPTLPVSLGTEKQTNVFLRAGSAAAFADLRAQKDAF